MLEMKRRVMQDVGAAAVEFALVAGILFTLLFGTIQFGYSWWEYLQVAHAAREGVRWAALGASDQVVARAQAAAPGLKKDQMKILTDNPTADSVSVSVEYPRTVLIVIPGLPKDIKSVAVQRLE